MTGKASRRERVVDQAIVETGAHSANWLRALGMSELRDVIKSADASVAKRFDTVVKELRQIAVRESPNRELVERILQDPVSSILGRVQKGRPFGPPQEGETSATYTAAEKLASKKPPKPHYGVIAPEVEARVAARIKELTKTQPQLANSFRDLGLSIEAGTSLMFRVLDYSKARSAAGVQRRIDSRGGILYETLLPFLPGVIREERTATVKNATDWIQREPERFGAKNAQQAVQLAQAVSAALHRTNDTKLSPSAFAIGDAQGAGFGEVEVLGNNLWLIRLTQVHDEGGKLMSDHVRTLMSFTKKNEAVELMPSSFGESKFESGYGKIVPQLITNVTRSQKTLRASNVPDLEGLPIHVRWGKALVVVIQSEKEPPKGSLDNLESSIRSATRASSMEVRIEKAVTPEQALACRKVVELFMKLVAELGPP